MSDVVPFAGANAVETRKAATEARVELARQQVEVERRQAEMKVEMERQRSEMEAAFRKQMAELNATMAPLKEQLARLTEVMWSVDLYLGRDETLQLIRDGEPAPADTPIHLRQRVLVMAEESLVLMGKKSTGMDHNDIPEFVNWLLEDDANLNRILPEQKGVVVLIPTKVVTSSGNIFEDAYKRAANEQSYWLIRNGEKVYLLTVDPELRIFDRVLPRRTEFVEVFDKGLFGFGRRFGEPVVPGSDEWLELEKKADAKRRHYMRVLLVLQGIMDRTPAWHPLPEGGASFLRLEDQDEGKIVLVQDGDDALQLTDGRESFSAYQRRLNALLRPGMRVIGDWRTEEFRDLRGEGWNRRSYHPRLRPDTIDSVPESNTPHLIEGRRDGGFVIRFKRSDKVWKRNVPVPDKPGYVYRGLSDAEPSVRASCLVMPSDSWVLPLDLVTVADLNYYLNSRDNRSKSFLTMVPTIQAALEVKAAEAATEAPFRDLIARLIMAEGAGIDEAPAIVDELVHWWKVANTWARPLNGEPKHEAKAATQIVAEYKLRQSHAGDDSVERMIAAGRTVPGAVAVARDKAGKWHVYAASPEAHDPNVFLDITPIRKDGTLGTTESERVLQKRTASALFVAWQADEWKTWHFGVNAKHYLTAPERQAVVDSLRDSVEGTPIIVTEYHDPREPAVRTMAIYAWRNGRPSEAEARATSGLGSSGWGAKSDDGLLAVKMVRIEKDAAGVATIPTTSRDSHHYEAWEHFSPSYDRYVTVIGGTRRGGLPYWPDDAVRYSDARPRLAWVDQVMFDEVMDYSARCATVAEEELKAARATAALAHRYVTATWALIDARQQAAAHVRFVEDFGTDAEDLWPAHLKSLNLKKPLKNDAVDDLVRSALDHDDALVGQTLQQLADTRHEHGLAEERWTPTKVDVGDYGDIVVPALDEPEGDMGTPKK
ncbi:hypothetical protein GCM10025867_51340 (plasmid) [Frondihabitans sucicola]|uniref:Phage portal protein n=1 Tax=Frondihabitans sucicola TaxID=1268041 RepID=A0ABM8GWL8_9MICO|nr:hypothetical protein GCM10025867_45670 [Frondihabitans sucicola]BDZ52893.1 hypothetical protein GCM10025867_51340 [Frondihabitans sucicola]